MDPHASLIASPALAASGSVAALYSSPSLKRRKLTPPPCERVMIYVRQENELAFTPLHLVPPTSLGLLDAVSCSILNNLIYILLFKEPLYSMIFYSFNRLKVNINCLHLLSTCSTGKTLKGNYLIYDFGIQMMLRLIDKSVNRLIA